MPTAPALAVALAAAFNVAATLVDTAFALLVAIALAVAVKLGVPVGEAVPLGRGVMVGVLVKVELAVNVGDGVKVLVAGINWVGVLGRVDVGPPGVLEMARAAVGVKVGVIGVADKTCVGVGGREVAVAIGVSGANTRAIKPAK